MAVTTWTAGQVLTAADLNDTLASKVDYALPVNAQTGTTYTFVAADAEKLTTASNAAAVTLTIPPQSSVTWSDNTVLRVVNYGAGAVTIDGGSGVTVTNTSSTIAQYGAAVAIRTGSDAWTVVPFGGGDVPPATVSSPAATGQYTDGSGDTWDYYTFTASGTLTVDTAGFADVLVVGGGAAGGSSWAGGGGAGGHLYVTNAYVPSGSLTVTVGAGGAAFSSTANDFARPGRPGISSRIGNYFSPGGGGGGTLIWGSASNVTQTDGDTGASGGGGSKNYSGGAGITDIGNDGGAGGASSGGGGGGAGASGSAGVITTGGAGGAGVANSITGSSVTRAGGGGGSGQTTGGAGGTGGGGAGAASGTATSGTANTGGGGGGMYGSGSSTSGAGGSGIVIVRVKV